MDCPCDKCPYLWYDEKSFRSCKEGCKDFTDWLIASGTAVLTPELVEVKKDDRP